MKGLKKNRLAVFMAVMMVVSFAFSVIPSNTALAQEVKTYNVWVNGVQIDDENKDDLSFLFGYKGRASYDPETKTLNVCDYNGFNNIKYHTYKLKKISICSLEDSLTVQGACDIQTSADIGLYCKGDLRLEGAINITANTCAVYSEGNTTIINGTMNFTAGQWGLYSEKKTDFKNGMITVKAMSKDYKYAIYAKNGIKLNENMVQQKDGEKPVLVNQDDDEESNDNYFVDVDTDNAVKTVGIVGFGEDYGLYFKDCLVNSFNRYNIPGTDDGIASFDPKTETLDFCDVNIDDNNTEGEFISYSPKSALNVTGNAYVSLWCSTGFIMIHSKQYANINIDADLNINLYAENEMYKAVGLYSSGGINVNGGSLDVDVYINASNVPPAGEDYYIRGVFCQNGQFAINAGEFHFYLDKEIDSGYHVVEAKKGMEMAKGMVFVDPEMGTYDKDKGDIIDKNGNIPYYVFIRIVDYKLKIGNCEVTSANNDNIPAFPAGQGSATYDPQTKTLKLSGVKGIIKDDETYAGISSKESLIIEGDMDLSDPGLQVGVVCEGDLTIKGNLSVKVSQYALACYGKILIDNKVYLEADRALSAGELQIGDAYQMYKPEGGTMVEHSLKDKYGNFASVLDVDVKGRGGSENPQPANPQTAVAPASAKTDTEKLTVEQMEQKLKNLPDDNDPSESTYSVLQAKASKASKNRIKISWKKVPSAKGYIIYGNKCGAKNKYRKIADVTKMNYTQKKLKKGTYYKYIVVAYDNAGKVISVSRAVHAATLGGKVGNTGLISTKAKKNKVSINVNKTFKLKAKERPADKKLKVKKHRAVMYESSNEAVAVVSNKGEIKGISKGNCEVYVFAQNGIMKKIKVTVK